MGRDGCRVRGLGRAKATALRTARSGWHQTDTREECQSIGGDQPSDDQCAPIELRVESVQRNVGPRRPQRLLVLLLARDTLLSGLVVRAAAALAPRDPLLLLPLLALELARLVPRLALARGRPRIRARPALWRRALPSKLVISLAGWRAPPPPAPRRRPAPSIAVGRAASPARRAASAGRAVTPRRAVPLRRRAAPSSSVASVAHLLVALRERARRIAASGPFPSYSPFRLVFHTSPSAWSSRWRRRARLFSSRGGQVRPGRQALPREARHVVPRRRPAPRA